MNLYFADRLLDIKGMGSTAQNSQYQIINDTLSDEIKTGIKILEFDVRYRNNVDIPILKSMMAEGNYILYDGVLGQACFTAIEVEHDPIEKNYHIYAEDAGLDLINETKSAIASPNNGPKPIEYYITRILDPGPDNSSDWKIGINELDGEDKEISLSWDSEMTCTELLSALASSFGVEIAYRFTFSGLSITKKYIDIYKKRGKEVYQELRLGREIENMIEKRSIANLATALIPVGSSIEIGGEESDPINLDGETYDDGDFYIDGRILKSRIAVEKWGRYNANHGYNTDYTVRSFTYETTDKVALRNAAIEELKKRREPEVTYQVSLLYLPENLNLGDTIYLVDDASELYLSARLLKLEVSESNGTRTAEFGDYVVKESGIMDRFLDAARGVIKTYTWIVYADTDRGAEISINQYTPTGRRKRYMGIATNKSAATPVLDPSLYKWTKLDDNVINYISKEDRAAQNEYFVVYTDPADGNDYVVTLATWTHCEIFIENGARTFIYPDPPYQGAHWRVDPEGILEEMTEEEEAEYRRNYEQYVENSTQGQGIYLIHDLDGGVQNVKIISDRIDTNSLSINGKAFSDLIKIKTYTYPYSNLAKNGTLNVTAANLHMSTPNGYTPVSAQRVSSGNGNIIARTFDVSATGSGTAVALRNVSTGDTPISATVTLSVMYVLSNVISS